MRLALDERRKAVKVVEQGHKLITKGRWNPDAEVEIRRKAVIGLDLVNWKNAAFPDGEPTPGNEQSGRGSKAYDVSAIKREIMKTVLEAGWSYQPSMFMRWS